MTAAVILLGMPGTGKTTFLAAAYHALQDDASSSAARLVRLPTNRAYLEEIVSLWLAGQSVARNRLATGEMIELELRAAHGQFDLRIPDVAGESFQSMVIERTADQALVDMAATADGILLFVHPDHVRPRISVDEANQLREVANDAPPGPDDEHPFEIEEIADYIAPIDLLQWVVGLRAPLRTRVVVVVSAWDTLAGHGLTPPVWLSKMHPLLHQYLRTNDEFIDARIVGISAQGGDYQEDQNLPSAKPTERPIVVDSAGSSTTDLVEPLIWAALG